MLGGSKEERDSDKDTQYTCIHTQIYRQTYQQYKQNDDVTASVMADKYYSIDASHGLIILLFLPLDNWAIEALKLKFMFIILGTHDTLMC